MSECSLHPAALPPARLYAECEVRFLRRGGPGGQHRNKVSTAVALRHRPTGVQAEANERRSQAENQAVALFRLRINLAVQVRMAVNADATPSELWRSRCCCGRINVSAEHEAFPTLLAEALDRVAVCDDDIKRAAESLQCSASQLLRLMKKAPQSLAMVNARRVGRGLPRLR